jgi:hypothetical protein
MTLRNNTAQSSLALGEGIECVSIAGRDVHSYATLIIMIPLYLNPNDTGGRYPVEPEKIELTEKEIRQRFSGYTKCVKEGWYREAYSGDEYFDENIQYEIDGPTSGFNAELLTRWKCSLECRFQQKAIYMKLCGPILQL